ncbi:MAG: flagellar assembly protein FliW [Candidatus Sericytochromatia bacterium]|nr:flagellar assembly protein FliW [Candidatus Sericytochromatia bacterium]
MMKLATTRFGTFEIDPSTILHFPLGLLGLERFSRYIIIDSDQTAPMRWLQCVDDPDIALLIVEPGMFFPDYAPHLSSDDRGILQLNGDDLPVVASVVVIPDDPQEMTINLLGPLVINEEKRLGKQLVLADSSYSARQRLLPDRMVCETPVAV